MDVIKYPDLPEYDFKKYNESARVLLENEKTEKILLIDNMYNLRTIAMPTKAPFATLAKHFEKAGCKDISEDDLCSTTLHTWTAECRFRGEPVTVSVAACAWIPDGSKYPACRRGVFDLIVLGQKPLIDIAIDYDALFTPVQALHLVRERVFYSEKHPKFEFKKDCLDNVLMAAMYVTFWKTVQQELEATLSDVAKDIVAPVHRHIGNNVVVTVAPSPTNQPSLSPTVLKLLDDALAARCKKSIRKVKVKLSRVLMASDFDKLLAKDGSFLVQRVQEFRDRVQGLCDVFAGPAA